ncbi:MAG TPA: hypothetical protein VHS78_09105, partial [Candidatus Elarobacter sp.]|nr:hypothetical protein [Candidatus Elarobacter sp.]
MAAFAVAAPASAADGTAHMTVFAGTGRAGTVDGPKAAAEFIMPTALAVGPRGDLFVADTAAQRVRVVHPDGTVATVAGSGTAIPGGLWVPVGFKDGPAAQAQFNRPGGLAVAADGTVYVADTGNHCIRAIAGGAVTTFAGTCGTAGAADGARGVGTFASPRQIALAADGVLFVADSSNGVRAIDRSGTVSTVAVTVDKRVTGICVEPGGTVVIADAQGLVMYNRGDHSTRRVPSANSFPSPISGGLELGSAYAVACDPFGGGTFFTDLREDTVRHLGGDQTLQFLNGFPRADALLGNAWQSGMSTVLHGPMGIAFDRAGRLFVADSGHKRILEVSDFRSDRGFTYPESLLRVARGPSEYRIVVLGNSFVYLDSDAQDSIGVRVQTLLRSVPSFKATGRTPRVLSVISTQGIGGQASFAKEIVSLSGTDLVIILANTYDMGYFLPKPDWKERFAAAERDTVTALKAASIPSMFVIIPDNAQVGPLEQLYQHENLRND